MGTLAIPLGGSPRYIEVDVNVSWSKRKALKDSAVTHNVEVKTLSSGFPFCKPARVRLMGHSDVVMPFLQFLDKDNAAVTGSRFGARLALGGE